MAKTIKIYKNYGVLAAEKRNVYTYGAEHPHSVCSDMMEVEIPDGWDCYETANGGAGLKAPWGWSYTVQEVLAGNEYPLFLAMDKNGASRKYRLNVVN